MMPCFTTDRALPRRHTLAVGSLLCALIAGCGSTQGDEPGVRVDPGAVDQALSSAPTSANSVRATPVVLSEEEWTFAGRDGHVIRTPHYRLFTTESDEVLRERMPLFLEHAIAHYRSAITELPLPSQKLDTYLMDNRPQWETLSKRLEGDRGEDLLLIERGGYASRGIGVYFDIGLYDTLAIAAHEGWHQYTQRTFRDPLPIWLEEGLATYMEGHAWRGGVPVFRSWQNLERFNALVRVNETGELLSVETIMTQRPTDLLGDDPKAVLRYYAQVWALTHFLMHGQGQIHADGLRQMLLDAAEGRLNQRLVASVGQQEASRAIGSRTGDAVARAYFGSDAAGLDTAYRAFVARITRSGARDAISTGRSPL
ncbi:MAG: hypothetical protein Tsb0013_13360 [Phycisphaerales bacterium]